MKTTLKFLKKTFEVVEKEIEFPYYTYHEEEYGEYDTIQIYSKFELVETVLPALEHCRVKEQVIKRVKITEIYFYNATDFHNLQVKYHSDSSLDYDIFQNREYATEDEFKKALEFLKENVNLL